MSLCDSCKYQYYVEQLKPCIIYRNDCEFYEPDEFHEEPKTENPSVTHIPSYDMDGVFAEIEKFTRLQREHKEQTLAEIITKYDFIVGSKECKFRLMEILPEGANIICSPYIESPTTIYAIKKFDVMDLLIGTQESEDEE